MKAKAKAVQSASPYQAENADQTRASGFALDFQDLCSQEMDLALGIHKASLDHAVQLHSCATEMYKALDPCGTTSWFVPVFEALLDTVAKSFAHCVKLHGHCLEMHRTWLTLLPNGLEYRDATSFLCETDARADDLAYHMDTAIGERHIADGEASAGLAGFRAAMAAQAAESGRAMRMRAA
jgi:hypothetical protein